MCRNASRTQQSVDRLCSDFRITWTILWRVRWAGSFVRSHISLAAPNMWLSTLLLVDRSGQYSRKLELPIKHRAYPMFLETPAKQIHDVPAVKLDGTIPSPCRNQLKKTSPPWNPKAFHPLQYLRDQIRPQRISSSPHRMSHLAAS
jgi:hypothetical protein